MNFCACSATCIGLTQVLPLSCRWVLAQDAIAVHVGSAIFGLLTVAFCRPASTFMRRRLPLRPPQLHFATWACLLQARSSRRRAVLGATPWGWRDHSLDLRGRLPVVLPQGFGIRFASEELNPRWSSLYGSSSSCPRVSTLWSWSNLRRLTSGPADLKGLKWQAAQFAQARPHRAREFGGQIALGARQVH